VFNSNHHSHSERPPLKRPPFKIGISKFDFCLSSCMSNDMSHKFFVWFILLFRNMISLSKFRLRYLLIHLANGVRLTLRSMLQTSLTIYSLFLTEISNNFCNRRHFKGFYGWSGGRSPLFSKSKICSERGVFLANECDTYFEVDRCVKCTETAVSCAIRFSKFIKNTNLWSKIYPKWQFLLQVSHRAAVSVHLRHRSLSK